RAFILHLPAASNYIGHPRRPGLLRCTTPLPRRRFSLTRQTSLPATPQPRPIHSRASGPMTSDSGLTALPCPPTTSPPLSTTSTPDPTSVTATPRSWPTSRHASSG